jgi:hypothetical protein
LKAFYIMFYKCMLLLKCAAARVRNVSDILCALLITIIIFVVYSSKDYFKNSSHKKSFFYVLKSTIILQLIQNSMKIVFPKAVDRCQFHQGFTHAVFVQNFWRQNFKPKSQLCSFGAKNFIRKMRM